MILNGTHFPPIGPVYGVGGLFGSVAELFIGYDPWELQAKGRTLDEQLAKVNQEAYERGQISAEVYQQTSQHIAEQEAETERGPEDIGGAFVTGAREGLQTEVSFVHDTIAGAINTVFGVVPWQLWALGGVALFIYMGGHQALKGSLARRYGH